MEQLFVKSCIIAFCSAVCGFIYIRVLLQPGHILEYWKRFLYWICREQKRFARGKHEHPVYKVLAQCELCNSGQIAFWSYILFNYKRYIEFTGWNERLIIASFHVFTMCGAILLVTLIKYIYDKEK